MTIRSNPPGPKSKPLVGHLIEFRNNPADFLLKLAREHGDIVHFKLATRDLYLINNPDYIRDVLVTNNKNFVKSRGLEMAKQFLGEGLLTSEGEFHRRQRRLAQPGFHRQRIISYGQVMADYTFRTRERWRDGETIDVSHEMMRLTMAIVAKTLFDADVESEAKEIGKALGTVVQFFNRITMPFPKLLKVLPLPSNFRYEKARRRLDSTIFRIIDERRSSGEDRGDLLSMLMLAEDEEGDGGQMTNSQLRDEAMTIFLAGHETTANALTWTWYLLAEHPEIEARLHEEIDAALGGRLPCAEDVPRLSYTMRVFSEAMRLYPPAWTIGRRALNDYEVGGYVLPRNSILLMSQWVMHHDERYYKDAFKFDPDRWTPEQQAARPKFSYFPFGGGPRVCIGEQFAWMEGVLLVAALAQKWRMRLVPGHAVETQPLITLRPKNGMPMRIELRKSAVNGAAPLLPRGSELNAHEGARSEESAYIA